jgi:D-alanyl-D-alanine carboxypeptidase
MEIVVRLKDVYGNTLIYPANAAAEALAEIAGTKTLTPAVMRIAIEKLGMTSVVIPAEVRL